MGIKNIASRVPSFFDLWIVTLRCDSNPISCIGLGGGTQVITHWNSYIRVHFSPTYSPLCHPWTRCRILSLQIVSSESLRSQPDDPFKGSELNLQCPAGSASFIQSLREVVLPRACWGRPIKLLPRKLQNYSQTDRACQGYAAAHSSRGGGCPSAPEGLKEAEEVLQCNSWPQPPSASPTWSLFSSYSAVFIFPSSLT